MMIKKILTICTLFLIISFSNAQSTMELAVESEYEYKMNRYTPVDKYELGKLGVGNQSLTASIKSSKNIEVDKSKWIPVEVSHYSDLQVTDNPKYAAMNCIGGYLKPGDFAFPIEYPVGTRFLIRYEDGTIEEGVVMDRGNPKYVRKYTRNEIDQKGAVMKIDRFMQGLTNSQVYALGIKKAEIRIIDDGWNNIV